MAFSSCLSTFPRFGQSTENDASFQVLLLKANATHDCISLQNAVVGLFQKRKIGEKELTSLHAIIRNLLSKKIGPFLFDWFQIQILTKGMIILRENIRHKKGKEFLESLENEWFYFFTQILPMLQIIFFMLQQDKDVTLRQAAIISFRDLIVLKLNMLEEMETISFKINSGLKHMFLILQSIHECYPPNENQLQMEKLTARVIVPFLGFQGYYEGGSEPLIESSEPILAFTKRSAGGNKRIFRPLSVQAPHSETLEDMFRMAESRSNSVSEV